MREWIGVREEALNVLLAELLAERGLKALGEVSLRKREGFPDVLLDINGVRIIIEGKKLGQREELRRDCQKRLDDGVCDICVAIEYAKLDFGPSVGQISLLPTTVDLKNALLKGRYNVGFFTYIELVGLEKWLPGFQPKVKSTFYENVDFQDLLTYLMIAYDYTVKEDTIGPVIDRLKALVFDFAAVLSSNVDIHRVKEALELKEKEEEAEE
jgi:hypothetical protein